MADWEQPSTSVNLRAGGSGSGSDQRIAILEQQLAAAMERIDALDRRVQLLEGVRAQGA